MVQLKQMLKEQFSNNFTSSNLPALDIKFFFKLNNPAI